MTAFTVYAESGRIVVWDVALHPSLAAAGEGDALRERAEAGEMFLLDSEDPAELRIELIVDGDVPAELAEEFEPVGGAFRLQAPSGRLRIADAGESGAGEELTVPAGEYLVRAMGRQQVDGEKYHAMMARLTSEEDWRFHRRVDRLGACGCLSVFAGIALLMTPTVRRYPLLLILFTLPTVLYFFLTRTPRYARAEEVCKRHDESLPHFVLLLTPSDSAAEIPGGWVEV